MGYLSFAPLHRPSSPIAEGGLRSERNSLDFVVDGVSLYNLVGAVRFDFIGLLGWSSLECDQESVRSLLLEGPTTLPQGRQSLFVCAECGDVGCGALTAELSLQDGHYIWKAFAYENNYDSSVTDTRSFDELGPFLFPESHYRIALSAALSARANQQFSR
jgi:hypothetical protein